MKNIVKISIFALLISIAAISCKKQIDPDQATGDDIRHADLAVSDVFTFTTGQTDNNTKEATENSDTTCFTKNTVLNPDSSFTTTINFNPNYKCKDGISRSGEIIINWQKGWRRDSTKYATVTFNKYSRDGRILSGNLKIKLISAKPSAQNPPKYKIVENNMKILFPNGQETSWEGTRTVEWLSGFLTPKDRTDDVKKINFNTNGVNRKGQNYTAYGKNLTIDNSCGTTGRARITMGTITILKNNIKTIIDFGDGECDDSYTITQNNITITIKN
jgi:hypothetical protein